MELLGKLKMLSSVVAQMSETYVDDNQIFFTQLLSNICKGYKSSKSNLGFFSQKTYLMPKYFLDW